MDEAFVLLRARAFADQRPLAELAADVVVRRLRLGYDTGVAVMRDDRLLEPSSSSRTPWSTPVAHRHPVGGPRTGTDAAVQTEANRSIWRHFPAAGIQPGFSKPRITRAGMSA